MTKRKKQKCRLTILFFASVLAVFLCAVCYFYNHIPETIYVAAGREGDINLKFPVDGSIRADCKEVVLSGQRHISSDEVHMVLDQPFSIYSETTGNYELCLKLFGLFEIKNIAVEVVNPEYLIPCGIPVGIYLQSDGILVIGTSKLTDFNGNVSEPALGVVKTGDYIVAINGESVQKKEALIHAVHENGDKDVILTIRRDGELMPVRIRPVNTASEEYKLGLWVRDDTQGIGTLTYVDEENHFGALGHGISDSDTNLLVQVSGGTLYDTDIRAIIKGNAGNPGSLSGVICYGEKNCYGKIDSNTTRGIFGSVNEKLLKQISGERLPVGYKQEVHIGPATIRCTVDGLTADYGIQILEVNTSSHNDNKGIVLQVTDENLLQKTGGIVQGMSGSPIIQDGKIIGAVTHVFIQDSTKGYGIFIEEMR